MLLRNNNIWHKAAGLALTGLTALLLAGCGAESSNEGPVGVTAEEEQMLNEAAEMLDERQAQLDADIEKERIVQENLPKRSE